MVAWVWQPHDWLVILIAVYMTIFSGRFTYEAVAANMSLIHGNAITTRVRTIAEMSAASSAASVFALLAGALGSGVMPTHPVVSSVALIIAIAAILLLPVLASKSLNDAVTPLPHIPASPLGGVLQDSLMVVLGAVFLGWVPIFALLHIESANNWWGFFAAYLTCTGGIYVFIMRNNLMHVAHIESSVRQAHVHGEISSETASALSALRKHIEHQNRIGSGAFFVFSLVVGHFKGEDDGLSADGLEPDNWIRATVES